jgi:hypothetical protein
MRYWYHLQLGLRFEHRKMDVLTDRCGRRGSMTASSGRYDPGKRHNFRVCNIPLMPLAPAVEAGI